MHNAFIIKEYKMYIIFILRVVVSRKLKLAMICSFKKFQGMLILVCDTIDFDFHFCISEVLYSNTIFQTSDFNFL